VAGEGIDSIYRYLNDDGDFALFQPGGVLRDAFEFGLPNQPGPGHGQVDPLGHGVIHAFVHREFVITVRIIRYGPVVEHPLDAGHRLSIYLATDRHQLVVIQLERGTLRGILDDRLACKVVRFDVAPQLVQQSRWFGARRCFDVEIFVHDLQTYKRISKNCTF